MELKELKQELSKKYNLKWGSEIIEKDKISSGIFPLDYILDGGLAQCEGGHRIEFWGKESCGKTTFALHIMKQFQSLGKTVAFIDAERSYDKKWASQIGINNEDVLMVYPDCLEDFGNMMPTLVPVVDLIVVDSIASMIPSEEEEKEVEKATMALAARINAKITRKIYNSVRETYPVIIFINQLRKKVGQMWGNPNTSGGGHALLHFYNTRVEFKTGAPIDIGTKEDKERIGYEINLNCIKNKRGKAYRTSTVELYNTGEIGHRKALFFAGVKYALIERKGNSYIYNDIKIAGKENFLEQFTDWDKLEEEVWEQIRGTQST